jgi:AraC-like DNA-binding protein
MTDPHNAVLRHTPGISAHVMVSKTHRGAGDTSVDHWSLGDGTWLTHGRYRGLSVSSGRDHRTDSSARMITVAVLTPGTWSLISHGTPVTGRAGEPTLIVLDQSSAFDFRGPGTGSAIALHMTHARLTLSIETIHQGIEHLRPALPLYPLVQNHVQQLGVIAAGAPAILPELAPSTCALVRSLLISAADTASVADSAHPLVTTIERYIDTNLDSLELTADTIAAAHNISPRQLYKIWPAANGTLAGHITTRRLERARTTLLTHRHLTIAAVARRHGFTQPTHFTHKFREVFGTTPTQWRRRHDVEQEPNRSSVPAGP